MPPLHRDEWREGQTKKHRKHYPEYVAKKISIWKNDKKFAESKINHAMATKYKLKNRIEAVKLRKKLPKALRRPRRARKGDEAIDDVDDSDSGPTHLVFKGAEKQREAKLRFGIQMFGNPPPELT